MAIRSVYRSVVPSAVRSRIRKAAGMDEVNFPWRMRSGVLVSVLGYPDWYVYNEIFVNGEYDEAIEAALRGAPAAEPVNVVDLGANVGFFTLRFVDRLRALGGPERPFRVTMVEGMPELAREAERRVVEANGLAGRVRVVQGLVGKRGGSARIHKDEFGPRNRLSGDGRGKEVGYVDLEAVLGADMPIHLLKCDIEGSEEQFAESYGELLRRVHTAVFEFHPDLCDTQRCRALLRDAGLIEAPGHPGSQVVRFARTTG